MKLFKVAVIAAIVVSGSAFAGAVPQFGGGHGGGWGGGNNGPDSTLSIYQYGGGNSALALRRRTPEILNWPLPARGGGNGADVGQGRWQFYRSAAKGFGNSATIDQWNSKDSVINVKQFGGGNGAAVEPDSVRLNGDCAPGWLWQQRDRTSVLIQFCTKNRACALFFFEDLMSTFILPCCACQPDNVQHLTAGKMTKPLFLRSRWQTPANVRLSVICPTGASGTKYIAAEKYSLYPLICRLI